MSGTGNIGAGAGAGGDVATGEMSIQKQLFASIEPEKNLEEFIRLLEAYTGDWAALTDTWSRTPLEKEDSLLIRAARNNRLDIVNYLLGLKEDPEEKEVLANQAKASNGVTPLFIASEKGHLDIVNALLAAGAAINKASTNGETPLYIASRNDHKATVKVLLDAGAAINQALIPIGNEFTDLACAA